MRHATLIISADAVRIWRLRGAAAAQTGYVGILGGGPIYKDMPANILELRKSGFNELIVWSVEVNSAGDLNLNGEFPLTSAGAYIGHKTTRNFRPTWRISRRAP